MSAKTCLLLLLLLFFTLQVLADRINLPCKLVKGSCYAGTDEGAVNFIKVDYGRWFFILYFTFFLSCDSYNLISNLGSIGLSACFLICYSSCHSELNIVVSMKKKILVVLEISFFIFSAEVVFECLMC